MLSKRIIPLTFLVVFSALSFIALVGARGSFSASRGSVNIFGEITGKYDKDGEITLTVMPLGNALELVVTCRNQGGNEAPGVNPVILSETWDASADISGLSRKKGKVTINEGQLSTDLNLETLSATYADQACPNGNWSISDAYPGGFHAVIKAKDGNGNVGQQIEMDCGTTLASGNSPFVDGDLYSGTIYDCTETLDTNNP